MELLLEAVSILSPNEMHNVRKQFGVTFRMLAQRSGVSSPQLCSYEHGLDGLRPDQVQAIRDTLVAIAHDRSQVLSKLLGREMDREEMPAAG